MGGYRNRFVKNVFSNQVTRFDAAFGPRPASIHISGVISYIDEMCFANLLVALEPISGIEKAGNRVMKVDTL